MLLSCPCEDSGFDAASQRPGSGLHGPNDKQTRLRRQTQVVTETPMHKEGQAITTPGETLALDATRSAWYAVVIWSLCAFAMR